jgi:integrase
LFKSDIDWERRLITVRRGVSHRKLADRPKTPRGVRQVPVSPALLRALRQHLEAMVEGGELVFPNTEGRHAHYGNFHQTWKRALVKAEVPYRSFHKARHSFATRMRDAGVKLEILQAWLGHASIAQTADTYVHTDQAAWADAVRALEQSAGVTGVTS